MKPTMILATTLVRLSASAIAVDSKTSDRAKAQDDRRSSGEIGYTVGCSAAAAAGIPSCGELPSGKQFLPKPDQKASPPPKGTGLEKGSH